MIKRNKMIEMSFKTFTIKVLVFILSNLLSLEDKKVDIQQLNVPNRNITLSKLKINQTYIVLSYFSIVYHKSNKSFYFSKCMIYYI